MPYWGTRSLIQLKTCHPDLQTLANAILRRLPYRSVPDVRVLWGHRNEEQQEWRVAMGYSKLRWPYSKHNRMPSTAMDLEPWIRKRCVDGKPAPVPYDDLSYWMDLRELTEKEARMLGIEIRHGSAWNDWAHIELI